ncbi:pyridoxamine 5'-phosphate oxidase family protein [Sulfitobacter sp.]|uniref:pyridoxamine 5'-phosphate oxidase family protein n=1 Tax=Sulfitobacter sp. TaxID=1903071 RepID=UPI003001A6D1
MADLNETFWNRLSDSRTGMLGTDTAPAAPMTHYVDAEHRALWFITAKGTNLGIAAAGGASAQYIVCDYDAQLYTRIDGTLRSVIDRAKLDDLWSVFAAAWFEDGKQDYDVELIRLDLTEAEVWSTGGKLSFFHEIAKANLGGSKPDVGEHGTLRF